MLHARLRAAAFRDPELITNGTFESDASGWTLLNSDAVEITSVSGEGRITTVNVPSGAYQQINTEPGAAYTVRADIRTGTSSNVEVRAYDNITSSPNELGSSTTVTSSTSTEVSFIFTAVDSTSEIYLRVVASISTQVTGFFDNVSVVRS